MSAQEPAGSGGGAEGAAVRPVPRVPHAAHQPLPRQGKFAIRRLLNL